MLQMMEKIHSRDTKVELLFRKALWARGLRYKTCPSDIIGKPDIVFTAKRVAIFVDGDYWHGGQWSKRKLKSLEDQFHATDSRLYWLSKIRRNMRRDCLVTDQLIADGWTVLRFWESEIKKNLEGCVAMALKAVQNTVDEQEQGEWSAILPQRTVCEFFAGIGLMRLGLERQGWSVVFANDIDEQKQAMYQGHYQTDTARFVLGDIHKIPAADVPTATLATASFPCNDLSLAGARKGLAGQHSSAFWGFARILEEMDSRRPPFVLLENVPGFLTSHDGMDFYQVLQTLNRLGYSVDTFIIDASRFVPQSRQRLFVVGLLDSPPPVWEVKEQMSFFASDARPKALADFIFSHPDIRWNMRELPQLPTSAKRLEEIIEDMSDDAPEWWSRPRVEYLLNQMSPRHLEIADRLIAGAEYSYGTVFRRIRKGKSMAELRTDGLAGCLRTPRGGSGRQILFKAGKGQSFARLLTPRECARLMGADDYNISAPPNQALFGFGDAVCVPVIEWIGKYYLNPVINELLRGRPIRHIRYGESE
jgi:DNA (cytosine-5)-methyltransferase 1